MHMHNFSKSYPTLLNKKSTMIKTKNEVNDKLVALCVFNPIYTYISFIIFSIILFFFACN